MLNKIMLINVSDEESRIAIVEDNVLEEMLIEHQSKEQLKGNIYRSVVDQVQSSVQAAFVDFGVKKHGFLPLSELNYDLIPQQGGRRGSIQSRLRPGQSLMVQVTKEAVDHKGASLTTNISLPGRFMVFMPYGSKSGVSKKIEDIEERERLKGFLSGIQSEDSAIIIRTAGYGRSLQELKKDYSEVKKTWEDIQNKYDNARKTELIQEEDDVVSRTLRDYFTEDISEVWVDNPDAYQKALAFLKKSMPRKQKSLKLFVDERSLFSTYHIEKQVEQLTNREVPLRSGGSIVIERTEALVAIDVNSGRSRQESNIDDTAVRTNMEAAEEVGRQLRLRNLGGLIVIDFIDMESGSSRKKVEEKLIECMARDKAQLKFGNISTFGLMEISRQRLAMGISSVVENSCPVCNGKGRIPSLQAATNLILRTIREMAVKGQLSRAEGYLPLDLANYLLNERRQLITDLELEFGIQVSLKVDPQLFVFEPKNIKAYYLDKGFEMTDADSSYKERPRVEPEKKHSRRKEAPKSNKPDDRERKQEDREVKSEVRERKQEDKERKPSERDRKQGEKNIASKMAVAPQDKKNRPPKKPYVAQQDATIHPGCLFQNVKELPVEQLEEISSSFENRVKGIGEEKDSIQIDPKYLWFKTKDVKATSESGGEMEMKQESRNQPDGSDAPKKEARKTRASKPKQQTANPPKSKTSTQEEAPIKETKPIKEEKTESQPKGKKVSKKPSAKKKEVSTSPSVNKVASKAGAKPATEGETETKKPARPKRAPINKKAPAAKKVSDEPAARIEP